MLRLQIILEQDEARVLSKLAASELRDPREQIHFILRQELERKGLLIPEKTEKSAIKTSLEVRQ